ncbi:aspartate-alanine antiporter [bacterium]|nr:aspartate-alanine antiporter [bacterium]
MDLIYSQLREFPLMSLFIALALGYVVGEIKLGKFQIGGIAGTLIVAVFIGQIGGIAIAGDVKSIFFTLFIFMVGYNGGPQFFASLNPRALKKLFAAISMTVLGLLTVLGVAILAGLDKGLAAGLAAGGLTQSAIIGTAGNAIDKLGLAHGVAETLKTNVAVGYSVTYIFGSIGPILMVIILPLIYKWNLKDEGAKLAEKLGGGSRQLTEGQFMPLNRFSTRDFIVSESSRYLNMNVKEFEEKIEGDLVVEEIIRDGISLELTLSTVIEKDDRVAVSGLVNDFAKLGDALGKEIGEFDKSSALIIEHRRIVLTNKNLDGLSLQEIHDKSTKKERHGVFIAKISRNLKPLETLPGTLVHVGDEITLVGKPEEINRVSKLLGYNSPLPSVTTFAILGLGMALGFLIGEISFKIAGTSVSLGSGLGCLVTGLTFGYLRTKHRKLGGINSGAANFLQSFGLAVFVGVVGINAGEPALNAIKEHGITLLLLGVVVTMIPQIVQFLINYYILKIKNPVQALAVLTGSRSGNPGFAVLLEKTGNSSGTPDFTMTYAVANIFLTLWGPIIVALIPMVN